MESVDSFDVNLFLCKAFLAQIKMSETSHSLLLYKFMCNAVQLEKGLSPSLPPRLDHLNQVLDLRWQCVFAGIGLTRVPTNINIYAYQDKGPVPLLPLAIKYNLNRYVKAHLVSTPGLVHKQPGRPLLDFALRRRISLYGMDGQEEQLGPPRGGSQDRPNIELVRLILERGGNPNEEFGNATVWKRFMRYLDDLWKDFQQLDKEGLRPWIEVTDLLIQYGAVRVLDRVTISPEQSSGRTRVKLSYREVLARTSIAAAFGEAEAARLDSMSWWLNVTEQNFITNTARALRSTLR